MMKSYRAIFAVALCSAVGFAQTPPAGFLDEVVWSGLNVPTGMAFFPDGRIAVCEQFSAAVKIRSTTGASATMVTVPGVSTGSERGLLSVCVDPQFPTRPYVYTWYSRTSPANMVLSMWTASGAGLSDPTSTAVTLANQYILIGDSLDSAFNHNGGTIRFGADGLLYLAIGDDASTCNAQNFDIISGCVLRLDVAAMPGVGTGPPAKSALIPVGGNPWNTGSDNRKLHYAKGLRNPFRFHIDHPTGELFIADVGQNSWEEVDQVPAGGGQNFGWPWFEGNASYLPANCGGQGAVVVTAPIATINHSTGAGSIISLGRYRTGAGLSDFGAAFDGDYFYVDYYEGTIRRLDWNGTSFAAPVTWGTAGTYGGITDAAQGTDGALYYCKAGSNQIRRIKSTANLPNVSIVSGNAQAVNAGWSWYAPLKVQVLQFGLPMVGAPVTFTGSSNVTMPPQPIFTDANGFAEVTPSLTNLTSVNPIVTATTPSGNSVNFTATWRGLTTTYVSSIGFLSISVKHSQANSPLTIALDVQSMSPFVTIPGVGDIWTSILAPLPSLFALDGLGILGPPVPTYKTNAASSFVQTFTNLPPLGGWMIALQAYAFDTAKTTNELFMISNRLNMTLL